MSSDRPTTNERLAGRDPIAVLQATPALLSELFDALSEADLSTPYAAGKWNPRQVLAHLADVELATGWRLRQTVAAPGVALSLWDQDVWAERYERLDVALALEAFRAQRAWNLALLASLSMNDWLAEAFHPERGFESVDQMVRYLAAHDLNHLAQLGVQLPPI
ncbi:MAG: DinB family protein [Trueperaceae bacterium]